MTTTTPWDFAGRIAGLVAQTYPLAQSYHLEHLEAHLPPIVDHVHELVAGETGLALPGSPDVVLVTRREWVDRNIASFARMLEPVERRLAERLEVAGDDISQSVARRLVAAETGAVLGVLARRVLGQYELVVPTGEAGDSIAFVAANILQMERAHQLHPNEFRTWIALHEATHRAQFVGVPWMRDHFFGLVETLVASAELDESRLGVLVDRLVKARRSGEPLVDDLGIAGLFATESQRRVIGQVQAMMSLLEGHGHVVMDRAGRRILRTQQRMSSLLKARRSDPRTARFFKLTGLEMKVKQYEQGERFVLGVERLAGWSALEGAWSGPEQLPTLSEIEEPAAWLRRVA